MCGCGCVGGGYVVVGVDPDVDMDVDMEVGGREGERQEGRGAISNASGSKEVIGHS